MKKLNKNELGFGGLELLLIIVIVVLLGVVGWYIFSKKSNSGNTAKNVQNIQQNTAQNSTKYLEIKEWGVRIPFASTVNLDDLYYKITPDNGKQAIASLGSHALTAAASSCDINSPTGSAEAWLVRQTEAEQLKATQEPKDKYGPAPYKVGDYYYGYEGAGGPCYDQSNTRATAIDGAADQPNIYKALKDIQAIPGI